LVAGPHIDGSERNAGSQSPAGYSNRVKAFDVAAEKPKDAAFPGIV